MTQNANLQDSLTDILTRALPASRILDAVDTREIAVTAFRMAETLGKEGITPEEAARLRALVAKQTIDLETLRAEVAELNHLQQLDSIEGEQTALWAAVNALQNRPLFHLPPESRGWLERFKSKKLLLTVFGVPIAWLASKLGVDQELVIAGIGALIAFVIGQSAVDSAAAKAAGPHAPPVAKE